ncbi:MAG: hypothetical protein Q9218_006118 [Villophora microphyllina]
MEKYYMVSRLRSDAEFRYDTLTLRRLTGPLGKRGWVFQEIVLSPRTLYYGADRLLWDCIECEADDAQAMQERLAVYRTASDYKFAFAQSQSTADDSSYLDSSFLYVHHNITDSLWNKVVEEYTNTNLTYESDKWLAISGLAERYMERTGRTLYAGLHQDQLLRDMGWWSHSPAGRLSNGAPTWSWLSCRSGVNLTNAPAMKLFATLVCMPNERIRDCTWHVVYNKETHQPAAPVAKPQRYPLTLSGHVRTFRYTSHDGKSDMSSFSTIFDTYHIGIEHLWLDLPLANDTKLWGVAYSTSYPFGSGLRVMLLAPATHDDKFWQSVGFCLTILFEPWDNRGEREKFLNAFGPVEEFMIV